MEAILAAKGDQHHIEVYVFEYNFITVPVGVMVICPATFVHIVYVGQEIMDHFWSPIVFDMKKLYTKTNLSNTWTLMIRK